VDGTYILRYHVGDRAKVDERLRAEIAWVSWPPWADRQSELFYDIYSSHADIMRRACVLSADAQHARRALEVHRVGVVCGKT
jgi:hypothetical protein